MGMIRYKGLQVGTLIGRSKKNKENWSITVFINDTKGRRKEMRNANFAGDDPNAKAESMVSRAKKIIDQIPQGGTIADVDW